MDNKFDICASWAAFRQLSAGIPQPREQNKTSNSSQLYFQPNHVVMDYMQQQAKQAKLSNSKYFGDKETFQGSERSATESFT